MKLLPTISFYVTTDQDEVLDEQCPSCAYFHTAHDPCVLPKQQRRPRNRLTKQRPSSSAPTPVPHTAIAPSRPPSYPEKRSRKTDPAPPRPSNEPPVSIVPSRFARNVPAPIVVPSSGIGAPRLRRRDSPTETSLRDLSSLQCQQQQARLRAQKSEIRLQRVYESQLESYLNGGFVALDSVQE